MRSNNVFTRFQNDSWSSPGAGAPAQDPWAPVPAQSVQKPGKTHLSWIKLSSLLPKRETSKNLYYDV